MVESTTSHTVKDIDTTEAFLASHGIAFKVTSLLANPLDGSPRDCNYDR